MACPGAGLHHIDLTNDGAVCLQAEETKVSGVLLGTRRMAEGEEWCVPTQRLIIEGVPWKTGGEHRLLPDSFRTVIGGARDQEIPHLEEDKVAFISSDFLTLHLSLPFTLFLLSAPLAFSACLSIFYSSVSFFYLSICLSACLSVCVSLSVCLSAAGYHSLCLSVLQLVYHSCSFFRYVLQSHIVVVVVAIVRSGLIFFLFFLFFFFSLLRNPGVFRQTSASRRQVSRTAS